MKYCLVADDGQALVVTNESNDLRDIKRFADCNSEESVTVNSTCKWHVCERHPSPSGDHLVTIETWEKGVKL